MSLRLIGLLAVPAVALVLLAAHFLHAGAWPVATVALLLIGLLAVRSAWAARTLQALLALGAIEWVVTAGSLAAERARLGEPYLRLLAILGAVALFTLVAAALFQHSRVRKWFRLGPEQSAQPAG